MILIGYSFGADVVPFLANRLPPDLAARVSRIVMMGPSGAADFRFHPTEWLGKPSPDSLPVLPELAKLRGRKILCAYGRTEKNSLCPRLPNGLADLLIRSGKVGNDYGPIADWILAEASPGGGVGAQ